MYPETQCKLTFAPSLGAGAAGVAVLGVALGCKASRAFFLATRGSPLFIARSVAMCLRRRFKDSADRDISIRFGDGLGFQNLDDVQKPV